MGVAAGVAFGIFWFIVTSVARSSGLVEWALDLPPARWARFRDLVVNEDIVDAGWERWEMRKRDLQGRRKIEANGATRRKKTR